MCISKLVLFIIGLMFQSFNVLASIESLPTNVHVLGEANGLLSFNEDKPFLAKDGMMPGDRVEGVLIIHNDHDYASELFLRAERMSEKEEYDLLSKLELTVYHREGIIYQGPACGSDGLSSEISLGSYEPGEADILYASVTLDGPTTTNHYHGKEAEVHWTFTATHEPSLVFKPENNLDNQDTSVIKPLAPITGLAISGTCLLSGILFIIMGTMARKKV